MVVRIRSITFGHLVVLWALLKTFTGMLVIRITSQIINGQWLQITPHGLIDQHFPRAHNVISTVLSTRNPKMSKT